MITYSDNISVDNYNEIRKSVGWNMITSDTAKIGLNNSICFVALDSRKPIALARIINNGGNISCIYDVIVLPKYQKKGIGTELMNRVIDYIRNHLKDDEKHLVCLTATKDKEGFYKRFGFRERPKYSSGAGMYQWIKRAPKLIKN